LTGNEVKKNLTSAACCATVGAQVATAPSRDRSVNYLSGNCRRISREARMRIDALINYFVLLLSFQDRASRNSVCVEGTKLRNLSAQCQEK
jgi:hypothetical protein